MVGSLTEWLLGIDSQQQQQQQQQQQPLFTPFLL